MIIPMKSRPPEPAEGSPAYIERQRRRRARKQITAKVRFAVLTRDRFRCVYCGATPREAQLEVDHVLPLAAGGTSTLSNLATACASCNAGKGNAVLAHPPERGGA